MPKNKEKSRIDLCLIEETVRSLSIGGYPGISAAGGESHPILISKEAARMIWQAALEKSIDSKLEYQNQIRFLIRILIDLRSFLGGRDEKLGQFLIRKPSLKSDKKHRQVDDIGLRINRKLARNKTGSNVLPILAMMDNGTSVISAVQILIQCLLVNHAAKGEFNRSALKRCAKDLNRLLRRHRKRCRL